MKNMFVATIVSLGVLLSGCGKDIDNSSAPESNATLPKSISEYAYNKYTRDQFPRLYENWGEDWIVKIAEFEKEAVNKIANEKNNCDSIDMVGLSENRSTVQKEAVFFVDCVNGERFYVSQNDIGKTKEVKSQSERAINESQAYDMCVKMVRDGATYPSSVNFKMLDSNGFTVKTTGNVIVNIGFEAKNGFGVVIPAKARCLFTPEGESEIAFTE